MSIDTRGHTLTERKRHYVKLPDKYRSDSYLQAIENALYRLLFVVDNELEKQVEQLESANLGGTTQEKHTTTRLYLSHSADRHLQQLQERHTKNKRVTLLAAFGYIDDNKQLYCINEE